MISGWNLDQNWRHRKHQIEWKNMSVFWTTGYISQEEDIGTSRKSMYRNQGSNYEEIGVLDSDRRKPVQ